MPLLLWLERTGRPRNGPGREPRKGGARFPVFAKDLDGERCSAAATVGGVRVLELESSPHQSAALVNQAFKTLKDPYDRAAYFLDLTGPHHSPQGQKTTLSPILLMEVMELKESLEEEAGERGTDEALSRLARRVAEEETRILDLMKKMDALLEGGTDAGQLPENDRSALRQALEYRKYLKSIERDLKPRPGNIGNPKH